MKSIIHSTENNNFYLYDTQRILSMLIHPELKKIHEKSTDINIDAYYLKKYSYLVNHGFFGEAKPFEFKANISENSIKENITQTKVIVFEITDYCNLKCKYCSLGDLYNFSKKESKNINIKYALNFLRYIFNVKHKKTKLTISFFGGEPLVNFPAKKVGGTIKEPSLLNIRQFVMDLMQQNNIGKQSATLSFDVQKFVSYDELKMTFGSNENTGLLFWGTSSAQYQNKYRIIRSSGLCIKFIQKYFTLDMDIPSNGLISGTIPGGYSPVYVSSIAYGRIGILTLETNYDYEKANKLVKETFNSLFINKNNTLTKEQEAFFNSAEMKVFIAGGSGVTGVKTIGGIKEFTNYITEGGEFSASSPGKPIFCSFANYSDDSPYRINFKIDIDSDPVYARLEYDITKDVSGGNVKSWYTDANVYLRFYADKACSIKTIAQNYIGFNINRLILQQYVGPNYSVSKAREVKLDQNLTFHNQTKGIEYPIAYGHRMTETIGTTYLDRGNWTNDHFYLRAGKFYQVRPPINMKYTCFIDYHNQNEYDCSDFE